MAKEDNNTSPIGKVLVCCVAAVFICLVTVMSIEWTAGRKSLGREHVSHIYSGSTFRLLSVSFDEGIDDQLFLFNYDSRYNDTFDFYYDEGTGSYMILYNYGGYRLYLTESSDHELILSKESLGARSRWNIDRIGNSMYFLITNSEDGLAICETDDCHVVMSTPDENNNYMQMRLQ